MSKTTKRKHVAREVLEDSVEINDKQRIVKILAGRGNNLHEVETPTGETFLVSMPVKFRKSVWIKRGDYVVIDPIEEGEKVKAEISRILYKDHIRQLKHQNLWPSQFYASEHVNELHSVESGESKDEVENLFVNTNRTSAVTWNEEEEDDVSTDTDSQSD